MPRPAAGSWWSRHWADLVGLLGAGAVVVGAAHWSAGAAWLTGGGFALAVALRAWWQEGEDG